jgi:hypothetical protein
MYQLLEYLLLVDPQMLNRMTTFLSINMNKEFWKEDQFFFKNKEFDSKFPEYPKQ